MMTCTFKLGEQTFKSEMELDEYLLNNKEFHKKYGDSVFMYTQMQNQTYDKLIESNKEKERLYAEGRIKREATVTGYSEDYYQVEKPYVGVNSFLRDYKRTTSGHVGDPLFPVFNMDNYIANSAKNWRRQEYWDNEASEQEIIDVFGEGQTPRPLTTAAELDEVKSRLEKKWKHQSFVGTAIHNAMNIWWTAKPSKKADVNTFEQHLRNTMTGKVPGSDKAYTEVIPDQVWKEIAEHCFGIEAEMKKRFGQDAMFLSEIGLVSKVNNANGGQDNLVGIADLLVIDKHGNINVFDYKTSPKAFGQYDKAKTLTFRYQLAVYRRMLQKLGFNLNENSGVYIIPFKFENFKYDPDTDSSTFDSLQGEAYNPKTGRTDFSYFEELHIHTDEQGGNIQTELNTFLPVQRVFDLRSEEMITEQDAFTKECFPVSPQDQELTDEVVSEMIKKQNKFEKDPSTDSFYYKIGKKIIRNKDSIKLIADVKKALEESKVVSTEFTQDFKRLLSQSQENGSLNFEFRFRTTLDKHASEHWAEDTFSKYMNKNWEVMDTSSLPILDEMGIILVKNKFTHLVNVIKLSNTTWQDLREPVLLGGADIKDVKHNTRKLITGTFESDIAQKQRPQSLALESTYGNIELMQTMNIINMLKGTFANDNAIVGEIMVVNPRNQQGITASQKQLLYNYRELQSLRNTQRKKKNMESVVNNFEKDIKIASNVELVKHQFNEVMSGVDEKNKFFKSDKWKNLKDPISALDAGNINPVKLRAKLVDLARKMEEEFGLNKVEKISYSEYEHPERKMYYTLHMAIAELDGIDFTQQLNDHSRWLEKGNVLKEGLSGTQYDNPGNMSSDTLNFISKQLNVAYQNIRNDMSKLSSELRNRVNKLKEAKKFGWLESRTIGNQTDLYQNMYEKTDNGDLRFKNPWDTKNDLQPEEREFLEYALAIINGNRYGITEEAEFQDKILNEPDLFFAVPLTTGSTASQVSSRGMMNTIKDKLNGLHPEKIMDTIRKKVEGYLQEDESVKKARDGERWQMINMFAATDTNIEAREQVIADTLINNSSLGLDYFERNLETILLKHEFAYSQQEHIDKVFPTIKAGMLHLATQGITLNTQFPMDMEYLSDFIKNKIFNLSIQSEKWASVQYIAQNIMSGASKLALAFNPRQMYQALDGIWKDISLYIRKPDGEHSFTAQNLKDSFFWIYKDLAHFGNKKSLAELINEQYGLNDMDINTLTSRMGSDNVGIWNFWEVGFRFASRPDFYNRMTIFTSQMRGDGCFEAHKVVDGKLVYKWEDDKRFDLFAKTKESEVSKLSEADQQKYKQQKALYIAMAKQFMAEHAVDPETGQEFVLDLEKKYALPRAYTTQQSESMKSLSDMIYGYYSHEKKALIQSTTFGAMVMQMNTYWSSKKNQWLAPGGIRNMGNMEQYERDGVKYWYKKGEDGYITNEVVPDGDPDASDVAYMQWKGQYQEGIVLTATKMIKDLFVGDTKGDLKATWDNYWNADDENLKRAYRNNLGQMFYDLILMFLLGIFAMPAMIQATKEHIKDTGNNTFLDAMANNALLNTVMMLDSSTKDFNPIASIGGKGIQWTPFSITSMQRTYENLSSIITGDRDAFDAIVKTSAATRTQEPIWDFVKISTLGREIGDNGEKE